MAPKSDAEVLKNIQNYVEQCRQQQQQGMDTDEDNSEDIEARLEKTVQELQYRLQRQQEELEKVNIPIYALRSSILLIHRIASTVSYSANINNSIG